MRHWHETTWTLIGWTGLCLVGLASAVRQGGPPADLVQDCVDAGFPRDFCREGMDHGYGPDPTAVVLVWAGVSIGLAGLWFLTRRRGRPESPTGPPKRWLAKLTLAWVGLWLLYQLQLFLWPRPAGPDGPGGYDVFLFFVPRDRSGANFLLDVDSYCEGGVYESILPAAAIGGVLWAVAAALGRRLPEHRRLVLWSFVVLYAASLIVLHVAAPALWGTELCLTD